MKGDLPSIELLESVHRFPGPYTFKAGTMFEPCDQFHFWSLHSGGSNFLFGDGAVRLLTYDAAPLLPALATRAGNEAVEPP